MLEIEMENLGTVKSCFQEVREIPLPPPPPPNLISVVLVHINEQSSFSSNSEIDFPGLR